MPEPVKYQVSCGDHGPMERNEPAFTWQCMTIGCRRLLSDEAIRDLLPAGAESETSVAIVVR
jgi:hypothetical protein